MNQYDVIVVGAGLAGLMAAKNLHEAKVNYVVFEKESIVGGRMATRINGNSRADYGAQFFTARSETMKNFAKQWHDEGIVNNWTNGFPQMKSIDELQSLIIHQDGYPRYAGTLGMNAITQKLAKTLHIKVGHHVERLAVKDEKWELTVRNDEGITSFYCAHKIILTSPIPQSLQLLKTSNISIEHEVKAALEQTSYFPCLTAILTMNEQTKIPAPGGIQIAEGMIAFIGDNEQKGISETTSVTIHGGDVWSRENEHLTDEEILALYIERAKPLLGKGEIIDKQVIRWKYSKPENLHPNDFAYSIIPLPIAFAGDIFKRGACEGAILSGLAASNWVIGG